MTPEEVGELVVAHLNKKWAERGSPNKMKAQLVSKGRPWLSNIHHPNYEAGRAAIKEVIIPLSLTLSCSDIFVLSALTRIVGSSH